MEHHIQNSTKSDLPFIFHLFDEAIEYQKRKNFPVWVGYDKIGLELDIDKGCSYKVVINDEIACIFTITLNDKIVWRAMDNDKAVYLHRIVINPKYKGQRIFGVVLKWAINYAQNQNIPLIRMDTWGNNPMITAYYESFGFGIVEYYQLPRTDELPIQQRGNLVVLLEYKLSDY